MTKPKTADTDPKAAFAEVFKGTGGIAGMTSWAKTHRTLFYSLFAKLLPLPQVTNFTTIKNTVNVDGEAARRELETAFYRLIDARNASVGDPAVYIDDTRLIEHDSNTPPSTIDPRPATVEPRPATIDDDNPRLAYRREMAERQREAADARRGTQDVPTVVAQPVSAVVVDEPSTTQNYLDWSANRRDRWSGG